jgi:hypothetical protein
VVKVKAIPRQRTRTQYRMLSTRACGTVSERRYFSRAAVERRLRLLTSDEPWRVYDDRDGDELACCKGEPWRDGCGCGGHTLREIAEAKRASLPPLVSVRVETRQVITSVWTDASEDLQWPR